MSSSSNPNKITSECPARIYFVASKDGEWSRTTTVCEHNHGRHVQSLSPRFVVTDVRDLILKVADDHDVSISSILSLLQTSSKSASFRFTGQQLRNLIRRQRLSVHTKSVNFDDGDGPSVVESHTSKLLRTLIDCKNYACIAHFTKVRQDGTELGWFVQTKLFAGTFQHLDSNALRQIESGHFISVLESVVASDEEVEVISSQLPSELDTTVIETPDFYDGNNSGDESCPPEKFTLRLDAVVFDEERQLL